MITQPQQPTQPEYHEIEEHICTVCVGPIENCSSFDDEFEAKDAELEAEGYVHNHCIAARRAADLTKEERFSMVRLRAAMEIIAEMDDELIGKFDAEKGAGFELSDLKDAVNKQLALLDEGNAPYSQPQLWFMREQDVITASVVLSNLSYAARLELRTAEEKPIETGLDRLHLAIKKDRYEHIEKAHQGMKEASYAS